MESLLPAASGPSEDSSVPRKEPRNGPCFRTRKSRMYYAIEIVHSDVMFKMTKGASLV
jgi:hypothetical protein